VGAELARDGGRSVEIDINWQTAFASKLSSYRGFLQDAGLAFDRD
jgi:hypothetical protein